MKGNLVILSVSSSLGVHQLSMWVSEVTVAEFTVEASCSACFITALLDVFQTSTQALHSLNTQCDVALSQ